MKIDIKQIPDEGLRQRVVYDPSTLDMERDDVHLPAPFEVDAQISKVHDELVVRAKIRCLLRMDCARCLDAYASAVDTEAVFSYRVEPSDIVDITDDVRQEIILAYPIVPVCRPDCRGLCIACGQNLNQAPCAHHLDDAKRS